MREGGPPIQRCLAWAIALLGAFLVLKLGFPPYGQYEDYNAPGLSIALVTDFGRYLAACLPLLGILAALLVAARRFQGAERRELLCRVGILVCLFAAAVIPYVVVGKPIDPVDFNDWTHRNALLLVVFGSLTFATLARVFEQHSRGSTARARLFGCIVTLFAISSGALLYLGYHYKVTQAAYMESLGVALEMMGEPQPGGVTFGNPDPSGTDVGPFYFQEFNALLERTFGKAAWISTPNPLSPQELNERFRDPRKYRTMWIYPDMTPDCISLILVERRSTGWRPEMNWLQLFGLVDPQMITARLFGVSCG
jgi:hypothetical protein